jgi:hypothetical protein
MNQLTVQSWGDLGYLEEHNAGRGELAEEVPPGTP